MDLTISVVRTGGVAGLRRSWDVHVERPDEIDAWRPLLDACPWESVRQTGGPDRFLYVITANERTATVPERELRGPWRDLTDRVRSAAEADSSSGDRGDQSSAAPPTDPLRGDAGESRAR